MMKSRKSMFALSLLFGWLMSIYAGVVLAAEYDSVLSWYRRTQLSTPLSGVVSGVLVQVGQKIKTGELLMTLDNEVYKAQLEKAKAELNHMTKLAKEAERELKRNKELYDQTVLADHDLALAKIAHAAAQAHYRAAQSAYASAKYNLKYSEIRAPFNAYVISRNIEIGETIVSQQEAMVLFVVADAQIMIANIDLTASEVGAIVLGQKTKVFVGKDRYTGIIQSLGMEPVAGKTKHYPVRVMFDTKGKTYRKGQPAKVYIP